MQSMLKASAIALLLATSAASVRAEEWVDWSPSKAVTQKLWIHVDPTYLDDYLTGLRRTWRTTQEVRKKHGIVDNYHVLIKDDMSGDGPNVLLVINYPSLAMMDADRDRALAVAKEYNAIVSKEETTAMIKKYGEWRKPMGENIWHSVEYSK